MGLSKQTTKSIVMPLAMVVGALLCRPLGVLETLTHNTLTPLLIAAMLFITFCRVELRSMRLSKIHLWMLLVQFLGSILVYYITTPSWAMWWVRAQ